MKTHSVRRLSVVGALVALPATLTAAVVVDGQITAAEYGGAGSVLSTQLWQTGFGDDTDAGHWGGGSELDRMLVTNDGSNLYVGVTGNLENNGNGLVILIDASGTAVEDGATTLLTQVFGNAVGNMPRVMSGVSGRFDPSEGLNGLSFDPGFSPTHSICASGGSPIGSQTRTYFAINWTTHADFNGPDPLASVSVVAGTITTGDATASGPSGTLGTFLSEQNIPLLGAADNTNAAGVEGADPPLLAAGDPATVTTGLEFGIPLSLISAGIGDEVCLLALVTSPDGYISNQLLPPPTEGDDQGRRFNLGYPSNFFQSLANIPGTQHVCYTIAAPPGCAGGPQCDLADINGDCQVNLTDLAILLANFGTNNEPNGPIIPKSQGNTDGDRDVDLTDLANLLGRFGLDCR